MKRKFLSILLTLAMALTLLPTAAMADETPSEGGGSAPVEAPVETKVAQIGDKQYATLAEAVDAVPTNKTETEIVLLKDYTGSGIKVVADKNIVFNLNGNTYTVNKPTVGSPNTETNGFQLLKGSKVTFKNGTLNSVTGADSLPNGGILIQNYCNLTLENVTLDTSANSNISYVISNNFGSLTAKGNTVIKAAGGKVAFDLWYGMDKNGLYDDGVSVTFGDDFTGSVTGKIEYGAHSRVPSDSNWKDKARLTIANGNFDTTFVDSNNNDGVAPEDFNISISGGYFISDPTAYLAKDCKIEMVGNAYGVVPDSDAVAQNGEKTFVSLQNAINDAKDNDTIKLLKDVDISETVIVTKAVKLDLNGKTISNTNDLWEKRAADWSLLSVRAGGDLNIHAVYVYQGELTVKGGAYSIQQKYPDAAKADEFVLNCYDKHRTEGTAKITVTGGTFVKFNPANCAAEGAGTNFVAAGYAAKKLEDDKYEVVALFDGGTGTAEDPFLIATSKQFKAIDQLNGAPYCFKQTADIAVAAGDEVTKFAGVYDGGNQELSSARTSGKFAALFNVAGLSGHATFKNIHVTMGELATSLLSCADWGTSYGADFENLTFTSTSELTKANSNNFGFVVINAIYTDNGDPATYNFKDITVNVNLQNAGTCTGVLIGSGPCFNISTTMNFINCTNNGTITGTSSVGFLYGNSAYIESLDESGTINVTNCTTNAVIKSTKDSADVAFAPGTSKSQKAAELNTSYQQADKYIVGNCLNGKTISVTQNAGADKFSIAIDDASDYTYKLVLNVAATYRTLDGEAWDEADVAKIPSNWDEAWNVSNGLKYLIALNKDASAADELNSFHAYDKRTATSKGIDTDALSYNEDGYAIVVKDGTNCIVFNTTEDTYIDSNVSILVYAYSGNTLVGTKAI